MPSDKQLEPQMQTVCELPDGRTLYYADPETFDDPGYKVWDPEKGCHLDVTFELTAAEATDRECEACGFDRPDCEWAGGEEGGYVCGSCRSNGRDLGELLAAVEPFTVDGGVGCGSEEIDALVETYERIIGGLSPTQPRYSLEEIKGLLLGEEAVEAAFDAAVKPARPRQEREDHRRTLRLALEAAIDAAFNSSTSTGEGGGDDR